MPLSSGCSYDMENHHYCGLLCVCWASQMYLLCFCESLRPRNTDLTKNRTAQELHRMLTCAVKANGRHSPSRRRCASCESGLFRAQTALESQMCLLCFRETLTLRRTGRQQSCTGCSSRRRCASCESGLFRAQTALESTMLPTFADVPLNL